MIDKLSLKDLRRDLKFVYKTVAKRRLDPGSFKAAEMIKLANLMDLDPVIIFGLVRKATEKTKKGK